MSISIYAKTDKYVSISDDDALAIASIVSGTQLTKDDLMMVHGHLYEKPAISDIYDFDLWDVWHNTLQEHPGWSILADMLWTDETIWHMAHNARPARDYCLQTIPTQHTSDKAIISNVLHMLFGDRAQQLLPHIGFIYWG